MVVYEPPVVYYDLKDKRIPDNKLGYEMVNNGSTACRCPIRAQRESDEYMASFYNSRTYNGD